MQQRSTHLNSGDPLNGGASSRVYYNVNISESSQMTNKHNKLSPSTKFSNKSPLEIDARKRSVPPGTMEHLAD
jgi:hypothetical protein